MKLNIIIKSIIYLLIILFLAKSSIIVYGQGEDVIANQQGQIVKPIIPLSFSFLDITGTTINAGTINVTTLNLNGSLIGLANYILSVSNGQFQLVNAGTFIATNNFMSFNGNGTNTLIPTGISSTNIILSGTTIVWLTTNQLSTHLWERYGFATINSANTSTIVITNGGYFLSLGSGTNIQCVDTTASYHYSGNAIVASAYVDRINGQFTNGVTFGSSPNNYNGDSYGSGKLTLTQNAGATGLYWDLTPTNVAPITINFFLTERCYY